MRMIPRVACVVLAAMLTPSAGAQGYPAKPIRIVVSSPPGGINDNLARIYGNALSPVFGQPMVVENRGGANGNIGAEACAKSVPDGYTVCVLNGVAVTFNPFAYAKMPFDAERELAPVAHLGFVEIALTVTASLPVKSVSEFVELARQKPGSVNWGSLGLGSQSHLYMEWMQARTGAVFNHIPYKGAPALIMANAVGDIHISASSPGTVRPHVQAGKMKVIAVVSGSKRSSMMPDIPTLAEQGYDLDFRNWFGLFTQSGVSGEIVKRWNAETNKLLADSAFIAKFYAPIPLTPSAGTPEDFARFIKSDRQTAAALVRQAKLKLIE